MEYKQLIQTHYFQEFERKRELNGNLSIVVGVITIIAAGLVAMLKALEPPLAWIEVCLAVGLASTAAMIGTAIYHAVRAFVGHAYRYVAPMAGIAEWRIRARTAGFDGAELDEATVSVFVDQYVEAIANNDAVNDRKSAYVHRSSQAAVAAMVLALVSAIPWVALEVLREPTSLVDPQKDRENDRGRREGTAAGARKGAAEPATQPVDQRE